MHDALRSDFERVTNENEELNKQLAVLEQQNKELKQQRDEVK